MAVVFYFCEAKRRLGAYSSGGRVRFLEHPCGLAVAGCDEGLKKGAFCIKKRF